jgi:tRNA pseudouridine55 synthase
VIDGALLLDKPVGLSSNAALQQAKRLYGAHKAGHGGTLDPLASGLLVVLFGEATKFAGPMLDADKEYVATLKLGTVTSTGDAEGAVLSTRPVDVDEAQAEAALGRFRGSIEQVPPMHSALKREGVALYKIARRGETVSRAPRLVQIHALTLVRFAPPEVDIRVRCSKGTYVRTLAEDIGAALGTGAHLAALRRVRSGPFCVEDAHSVDTLAGLSPRERMVRLLALARLLDELPRAELDTAAEARLRNGLTVQMSGLGEGICALYRRDGALIGLGSSQGGTLRPVRLTANRIQAAEKHR